MHEPLMEDGLASTDLRRSSIGDSSRSSNGWNTAQWALGIVLFWVANALLEHAARLLHISFPSSLIGAHHSGVHPKSAACAWPPFRGSRVRRNL